LIRELVGEAEGGGSGAAAGAGRGARGKLVGGEEGGRRREGKGKGRERENNSPTLFLFLSPPASSFSLFSSVFFMRFALVFFSSLFCYY